METRRRKKDAPADKVEIPKSQQTSVTRRALRSSGESVLRNLAILLLATLSVRVCELSLSPVYGSIPVSAAGSTAPIVLFAGQVSLLLVLGQVSLLFLASDGMKTNIPQVIPFLGSLVPVVQSFLYRYSGKLGPVWGPSISYYMTSCPILLISLVSTENLIMGEIMGRVKLDGSTMRTFTKECLKKTVALLLILLFIPVTTFCQRTADLILDKMSPWLGVFSSRFGLHALIAMCWSSLARSKTMLLFGFLSSTYLIFFIPHMPLAHNTASLNATLLNSGYSLVARQESRTGYISVIDNLKDGFRVMRCDHSVLGGEWINKPEGHPAVLNEPIYSIFVILEAVRLVETQLSQAAEDVVSQKSALVIGLGVGTASSALTTHGVHTTTLEIDPVVHQFAVKYFNLPRRNHTTLIVDAVKKVSGLQEHLEKETYDYIIHDVFTGGAEPIELFTQEFLSGLRELLNPDGTIAINYAGDLLLPSALSVITTIFSVFSTCRIFREVPRSDPSSKEDYTNLVLFCRKMAEPFTFRQPTEADFLGSPARRKNLLPRYEVTDVKAMVEGRGRIIRQGQTKWLEEYQIRSARGHWHVMRKVLPDVVWENW